MLEPNIDSPPSWSCGYQLRVRTGPNRGLTYIVDSPVLKLGRAIRPGERVPGWIRLNDDMVSRLHLELFWQEDRQCFRLLHRSSTNSTYVNGEIVEDVEIFEGDLLEAGGTTLELQKADLRWSKAESKSIAEWAPTEPEIPIPLELQNPPLQKIPGATVPVTATANRKLSIGPKVTFVLTANNGSDYELATTTIRLGSGSPPPPPEPIEGDDSTKGKKSPKFQTEYDLNDPTISFYNLIFKYDEIIENYKVARVGPSAQRVFIGRRQSGLFWQTELPEGFELPLLPDDQIQMGGFRFVYRWQ